MLTNDSVIEVFDDCFSVGIAKTIERNLEITDYLGYGWTYGHTAQKDNPDKQPFWMIDISSDPEHYKVFQGYSDEIFNALKEKFNFLERFNVETYQRVYMNGHTYGQVPNVHRDDGQITMIYQPKVTWKREWGGGTSFYYQEPGEETHEHFTPKALDKYKTVDYIGNRLIVFDADILHGADPIDRQCYDLRTVMVWKCFFKDGTGRDRLDYYAGR